MSCYKKFNTHSEYFNEPSPRLCKGGPYTWNGTSEISTYCKTLASTPEGVEEINRYKCGRGLMGTPSKQFEYTNPYIFCPAICKKYK